MAGRDSCHCEARRSVGNGAPARRAPSGAAAPVPGRNSRSSTGRLFRDRRLVGAGCHEAAGEGRHRCATARPGIVVIGPRECNAGGACRLGIPVDGQGHGHRGEPAAHVVDLCRLHHARAATWCRPGRPQCFYDSSTGQLISASFMDYAMPRAHNFPFFTTEISEVPSTTHPLGMRPAGEGGTTPALGLMINAVVDALSEFGVKHVEMPATPERIWRAIQNKRQRSRILPDEME